MSEQPTSGRPIDHEVLAEMLERSLSALPGIVRLEPTLKSTLTRVRSVSRKGLERLIGPTGEAASTGRDGIHLQIDDGVVQLTVELATDIAHSSVETAKKAQRAAVETIERAGFRAAGVDVSILSIESAAAAAEQPFHSGKASADE